MEILFEEKQYLGQNKHSIIWRTILALFCFVAYYWSENPKPIDVSGIPIPASPVGQNSGQLFFLAGILILFVSVILAFALHIKTVVTTNYITLDGIWTSRKVKIDLQTIVSAQKITYSKYRLNSPVYNLHFKGKISFYTGGTYAIELVDKEGLIYKIGSQQCDKLLQIINNNISKNNTP